LHKFRHKHLSRYQLKKQDATLCHVQNDRL